MKSLVSSFRVKLLAAGVILVAVVLFTACNKSNNDVPNTPAAGFMAFNLAPDKPSVGVSLSGSIVTSSPLGFNNYTGGYLAIYTGDRSVDAYDFNGGTTFASTPGSFQQDKYYSAFVIGANGTYRNVLVEDKFDSLSGNGAFIRYINAIPDSAAPVVAVSNNDGNVDNRTASFGTVSAFVPLAPGEVTVNINNGGTINKSRTFSVESRKVYTVLLAGRPNSSNSDSVQIRYIENGTIDADAGRSASAGRVSSK